MNRLSFLGHKCIIIAFLLFMSLPAFAQVTVTGTVVEESTGEPLIGATVVVQGTSKGTATDIEGGFTLEVPNLKAKLVVSYVGFATRTVPASECERIVLKENSAVLDEAVVVGFATQKKVNLTGAVGSVSSKDLENRGLTSVAAGLQGAMPGVTIVQNSGQPGLDDGGTSIRVRGNGTFNNAAPMVIVDGVESTMYDLDPNDIESISVLKDAASAAIYGSKAANGVILITTKRGKKGQANLTYSATFGWQKPTSTPEYVGSADYARLTNEARANDGLSPLYSEEDIRLYADGSDPYGHANTDWVNLLYQGSGFQMTHNLSLTGGGDNTRYLVSLGYQDQEGTVRNVSKNQYSMRMNLDADFSKRLSAAFSMAYSRQDIDLPTNPHNDSFDEFFRLTNRISPMVVGQYPDGTYGYIGDGNPIAWLDSDALRKTTRNNLLMTGKLNLKIIDGLTLSGILGYKLYYGETKDDNKSVQYTPTFTHGIDKKWNSVMRDDRLSADVLLNYNKIFGSDNTITALAGFHSEHYRFYELYAYREIFPSNTLTDINAGGTANLNNSGYSRDLTMLSWFGRVNYDYAGRYLLEANVRYDGSSRFGKGNRWGLFPSFSAGWRFSEEPFFESLTEIFDNAKLRASWGKLGNQNIGSYYPTISTLSLGKNYPFNGTITSGAYTEYAANPNLKWETTTSWGVGLDLMLFRGLEVNLDYYDKTTSGILMTVATPEPYALSDYYDNVGKVTNRGVELAINWRDVVGNVSYHIGGNFAYNKNRIKSMGAVLEQISTSESYSSIMRRGEAMNSLYGYVSNGFFNTQEEIDNYCASYNIGYTPKPGDLRYVDVNKDGVIDANDRTVLGSFDPGITFGFNLGANWKGLDFTANFQGAAKVKGYIGMEGIGYINGDVAKPTTIWLNHWTPENTNPKTPRLVQGYAGWSMPNTTSSFWTQDASYLRLKTLQLGYSLPSRWLSKVGISSLRIFYTAENLLTFTHFMKGYDPEAPGGNGNFYPQTKTHSFGLTVKF